MISVVLILRTVSVANKREHWSVTARRAREHRGTAKLYVRAALRQVDVRLPAVVTLTRVSSRRLDDDNLRGALKAVRDGVADALGVDDGSEAVRWVYEQRKGPVGVAVEVRGAGEVAA